MLHDTDNNTQLDGLEILKAFLHSLFEADRLNSTNTNATGSIKDDASNSHTNKTLKDSLFQETLKVYIQDVDEVLLEHDLDRNGYISYPEFLLARKTEA